ncbi:unnamed protein product [Schistosoma turkestanicum]|nr:unnamed protein product [Schistosoma turkestanicum]
MNILFPYSIPIPLLSNFYDHIMSQQNVNNTSSPCSSTSSACSPSSSSSASASASASILSATSSTSPRSYNLAVEMLRKLAAQQYDQQSFAYDNENSFNNKISPSNLQNLSLYLLNMTNSTLNSMNNNNNNINNNNDYSNPIHSTLNNEWNKSTDKLPTTCRQSRTIMNTMDDLAYISQDNNDMLNSYEKLPTWSNTLPNITPNAITAFQHALTQLALLGLSSSSASSSPSSSSSTTTTTTTTPITSVTNTNRLDSCNFNETNHSVLNLSNVEPLHGKTINNHYCKNHNCDIPLSISNQPTMYKKSEEGSKIIIRQTADADEHFFKALRGLKVDVSQNDLKLSNSHKQLSISEKSNNTSTISISTPTSIRSFDFGEENNKEWSLNVDVKKADKKRSAAELAVDEHFEKSLAAFRASASKKQNNRIICEDHLKSQSFATNSQNQKLINNLTPRSSDSYLHDDKCKIHHTKFQHQYLQAAPGGEHYKVNSLLQYNDTKPTSNPNLSVSCENTRFSPLTISRQLTSTDELHDDIERNDSVQVHSPNVTATPAVNRFRMKFASSSTSLPPLFPVNSFKPKKNWLAQYDWRYHQPETTTISPTTPNTNQSIFDSSGSSPSSVNIASESTEDVQHISNTSMLKYGLRNNNTPDTSNHGLSAEDAPDLKSDSDCIFIYSSCSSPSSRSSSCSGNNPVECCTINSPDVEHRQLGNTLTKSEISFPKFGTTLLVEKDDYFENESQEKSFNQERFAYNNFRKKVKNENVRNKTYNVSVNINDTIPTTITTNHYNNDNSSVGSNLDLNQRLSSSISSSPVVNVETEETLDENHSTGIFFSNGSTYSLDSTTTSSVMNKNESNSLDNGNNHAQNTNNSNQLKDEISKRCTVIQKPQQQQQHIQNLNNQHHHQRHITNKMNDNEDTLHNLWSLRKRVSSDVSPWSTLKRSRSVLTSTSLSNDKVSMNTVSSNEFCSEDIYQLDNNDCEMYNTNERGFVHSKSMDSKLNPFDNIDSNLKLSKCHRSSCKSVNNNNNNLLTEQKKTCSEPNVPDSRLSIKDKKSLTGTLSHSSFHQLESCHQNS